jgi:hypothetical protein
MKVLETQALFETMWFYKEGNESPRPDGMRESDNKFIVYFTASWCKACKNLNLEFLEGVAKEKGIPLWICSESVNTYTAGYCGVRQLPTFILMSPKTIHATCIPLTTGEAATWIQTNA